MYSNYRHSIFRMSDEETGKKDSKKYKELSRDRPSISFSLGRTKLKRHSEFTTNKNRKMPTSSPEVSSPIQWCSLNSKSHFARNLLANKRTCY